MMLDNIYRMRVSGIVPGTIALVIILIAVNWVQATPPVTQTNNSLSETGITYTQAVPFAKESIKEIIDCESNKSTPVQMQRVIPFHKAPQPEKLKQGRTPLKSLSAVQNELFSSLAPVLGSSFIGITQTGSSIPPDTMGAAGPSHLMEITNDKVGFFNKSTGALISNVTLQSFWLSLGTSASQPDNFPYDPKVIYDQHSGRFIAITLGGGTSANSWLMIAVSNTSDPTGDWLKKAIDANNNDTGLFADFPGLGVDANNVYVTANMFNDANFFQYSKVWVVPKTQLLNGNASITWTEFRDPTGSGFTMQPAHVFGSSSAEYFVNENFTCPDPILPCLALNNITFPGGTPTWNRMGDIAVNNYTPAIPDAPQLGTSDLIATNDISLLNVVFRDGFLWTAHTVNNTGNPKTEIAWYQINPSNASLSLPFGMPAQEGRISDESRWYYYPSIAVNAVGDVGIGFSGSSATEFAGAYYTARNASDAPGMMQPVGLLKAGLDSYTQDRWGDFSATVVDPIDDSTLWTVQEYAGTSNRWGTWWGKFEMAAVIPSLSISASSSTVTADTPTNVTFIVTSSGSAVSGATVTLSGVATGSNTTDANGSATIIVNTTGAGTIVAAANKTGYTNGSTTITASAAAFVRVDDVALFQSNGWWALKYDFNSITNGTADNWFPFGSGTAQPVVGDFRNTGTPKDVALLQSNGWWAIKYDFNNATNGTADKWLPFGDGTAKPVVGDFDHDGFSDDVALLQSNDWWAIKFDFNNATNGSADKWIAFGDGTAKPVVGDFDHDGFSDDVALLQSNGWWAIKYNFNSATNGSADKWIAFGDGTAKPVVGDFNGDGFSDDVALLQSNGWWAIKYDFANATNGSADKWIAFGDGTAKPVIGNFNNN